MKLRMFPQPGLNHRVLAGGIVVAADIHIQALGGGLDQKFLRFPGGCQRWIEEITVPPATLNAANKLVVPGRI